MTALALGSTIDEWLDDPVGGPLLRGVFERSGGDPDALSGVRWLSIVRIVRVGEGAFTPDMARELARGVGLAEPTDEELAEAGSEAVHDTASLVARHPHLGAVGTRELVAEGPHGRVPLRLYEPVGTCRTSFVWVHGGGFVSGDIDGPEANWVALELASRGIAVLTVQYRKAIDGVTYPVPADDVRAAWTWATAHADDLGLAGPLHLGGASAGAALAAATAVRVRDDGAVLPASVVLAYPIVHPELPDGPAATAPTYFTPDVVRDMNLVYAGSEAVFADPHAFAGVADLAGFPPTYILNSETDSLRASGERFAEQLSDAGVAVVVEFEPDTIHGHLSQPAAATAAASIGRIEAWLTQRRG